MAKKATARFVSLGADDSRSIGARAREAAKHHLSRKLREYLMENRMIASELARKADLPRDSVSRYILRKSMPTEESLRALARAMSCELTDLMPNRADVLAPTDSTTAEMTVNNSAPGMAWLRVNQLVTIETATKIITLLQADNDEADGKRGR